MTVAELIAKLSELPGDLTVCHCVGYMGDREPVQVVERGVAGQWMFTREGIVDDGAWVELI